MNKQTDVPSAAIEPHLKKADPNLPALVATGAAAISIRAGTIFAGVAFTAETPVRMPGEGLEAGADYAVVLLGNDAAAVKLDGVPSGETCLGGFHFAPGGNAQGKSGGDDAPAINPFSLWDRNFRPACPDPRGMTLVEMASGAKFWCDIYLLAKEHLLSGTSKFAVTIADGDDAPQDPSGGDFDVLDFETAVAVLKHHGKGVMGAEEFFAAAYGVTERTAAGSDPERTGLDAARTSKWGVMQATGNLWVWGHDGHPDDPRASLFGGSWFHGSYAGSRYADLVFWPVYSPGHLGARGRSDHLQPV
jgi:hypothetical protein